MRYINKRLFKENLLLPDNKNRALMYLRGYHKLKKSSNIEFISYIKNKLGQSTISNTPYKKIYQKPKEICLHQFICHRRLSVDFTKELLISIKNPNKIIKYGLPKKWRHILSNEGFKLSINSKINWSVYKSKWLLIALYFGLKEIKRFFQNKGFPKKKYIHSIGIKSSNLSKDKKLNNFFNWLIKQNEVKKYNYFTHTCPKMRKVIGKNQKIIFVDNDLPPIPNFIKLLKFTLWLFYNLIKGLFLNDEVLIFYEKIKEKLVLYSGKKRLANKYFFNHQFAQFRPLWTYQNLNKDFDAILYFYSTNNISYKFINKKHKQRYNWYLSNWDEYWVWNTSQKNFLIKNCITKSKIIIKGPIPFEDFKLIKTDHPQKSILIFDIQPYRDYYYPLMGLEHEYFTFQNSHKFIKHIEKVSLDLNVTIIIKRKRPSKHISNNYIRLINGLIQNNNWIEIDPRTSIFSAIEKLKPSAVISSPYTSAAFVPFKKNIPSIYYDPSNKLDPNFYANNGLPLIQSYNELYNWILKVYN